MNYSLSLPGLVSLFTQGSYCLLISAPSPKTVYDQFRDKGSKRDIIVNVIRPNLESMVVVAMF